MTRTLRKYSKYVANYIPSAIYKHITLYCTLSKGANTWYIHAATIFSFDYSY